jgi:NADPH2:quinone reductase
MRAIQIEEFGGPEKLRLVDLPAPEVGEGQVLVGVSASGVNFADTHQTQNDYLIPTELPLVPGTEVAGVVEAEAAGSRKGERVVAISGHGGYAEYAAVPAAATFHIPHGVEDGAALALLVQGLTAWHLLRTSARLAEGESVVVHAGAGGVGSLAVQLARIFGAGRVIATASTEDKRALALELGSDAAVDPNAEDLAAALREANGGARVDVVLEMAGGAVFDASRRALAPFGRLVVYGMASREPARVTNVELMQGSQAVVGFWLMHCLRDPERTRGPLAELFKLLEHGELRTIVGETYPLSEARRAHEDIAARRTSGKLVLDPAR